MGIGGKGGNEAALARQEEQQRQERIRQGTRRVNSIFDGGQVVSGQIGSGTAFDPSATYYNADGSVWQPRTEEMRGDAGPTVRSPEQQFAEAIRNGSLYSGVENQRGFDDNFFNRRRQAYIDYATPQVARQYGDAQKQLAFALDRGGLMNSSARGEKVGELQRLYDLQLQDVADNAMAYENKARTGVEDARTGLIATLNATGDAEGAANAALARSRALATPDNYSPLAQLFQDFTASLGLQAARDRAAAASGGYYSNGYAPGTRSSGRVTTRY